MKRLTFSILLFSMTVKADILMIGDSHTVGPFGELVHKSLAKKLSDKIILVYGHSSSAPMHWMNENQSHLSGGISHQLSYMDQYVSNTPDWRIKQPTLYLPMLLMNPLIYRSWQEKIPYEPQIDTIIIALGANDGASVATASGERTSEYQKRLKILNQMLTEIENRGIKCIWIGPPTSLKQTLANANTTYQYLLEGIKNRCSLFDSRKFIAAFCDKVHFSCPEGLPIAKQWANEASEFILNSI